MHRKENQTGEKLIMSRLKNRDADLLVQLSGLVEAIGPGLLTQAGISTAEFTAMTSGTTAFRGDLENVEVTRGAAKSAVVTKDVTKNSVRRAAQVVVDKLYATPTITNQTLAMLNLPPRPSGGTSGPPTQVTALSSQPIADGTAKLRWNRSGNTRSTQFLIEASVEGGPFVQIAQTIATRWTDPAATPGVMKSYRVVAFNAAGRAAPSSATTIYSEGEGALQLAA